ncbi:hypothetical protein QZH41_018485 [Actinostola sp. cb2023]|nr:hypothetical protein QZH41_018485 [Actinostola sp. cb2023]
MACSTPCVICSKKFVSSRTLAKHSLERHGKIITYCKFYDESKEVQLPVSAELDSTSISYKNYLTWLACVAERINGSHHPKCEGRWFRVDVFQAPEEFAMNMLWKLDAQLHSVRKMRHFKHPMMVGQSVRFAYRVFEEESVIDFLQEQKEITVRVSAAFDQNNVPVVQDDYKEDDPLEALKAAERRRRQPRSKLVLRANNIKSAGFLFFH